MKLAFIGAGGARTPLVIEGILQSGLRLAEVCLMDTDAERLSLMQLASRARLARAGPPFRVTWTTDAAEAIAGSDFVVTTFRAGLMRSRVVDEQVPLRHGVLGQETTGPGGFAMALRTIPVMLDYVRQIQDLAPNAWLLNFTNPAGIIAEAVTRAAGFQRAIGICDTPSSMIRAVARHLGVAPERLHPEYAGLNHLGWLRAVYLDGTDRMPALLEDLRAGRFCPPHFAFDRDFVAGLGALPNEYLYFYYHPRASVDNLLRAGRSRALQILPFNEELYVELEHIRDEEADAAAVDAVYSRYLGRRHGTYMSLETGIEMAEAAAESVTGAAEGYSAVALGVIAALTGGPARVAILNVPNGGAVAGMAADDVVEVTCYAGNGVIRPMVLGALPDHAVGLMKSVKAYERLTIQAAVERSYSLAWQALALHPLVPSAEVARAILDDYIAEHAGLFPDLK
jgi:6-phospho-beta-glucosidase